jgi:hypothetical protein
VKSGWAATSQSSANSGFFALKGCVVGLVYLKRHFAKTICRIDVAGRNFNFKTTGSLSFSSAASVNPI